MGILLSSISSFPVLRRQNRAVKRRSFSRDEGAQHDAAVTTLINNKADLQLEAFMQKTMDLQEGCRDALEVSGFI